MGKPGGFLSNHRVDAPCRDVAERLRDFKPVETRPAPGDVARQADRCMECGTPFCHGYGCPLANVVPEVNDLAGEGRWREAAELLLSTNNFPEFTGRVCPALCEASCVLGINDEPVTIRQIELEVIERAFELGCMKPRPPARRLDWRVAVTGSGPAGLAAADTLNRAGCNVTVFDRDKKPGGVLRYGIPDFKLEKSVIDRRVNLMMEEGVKFEMGVEITRDISCRYLKDRFDVICLSGGARKPRDLQVPGRDLAGIHFALPYLAHQNRLVSGESTAPLPDLVARGRRVVVIGGGDTGSDCVGTAARQGAKSVLQLEIMPKPPATRPESNPWPTWPTILRTSSSHKEGGERRWSVRTVSFSGKDGKVSGLQCVEVDWIRRGDGSAGFTDKPGSQFAVEADMVLLALGFLGPEADALVDELGLARDKAGNISVDENHMTSVQGVFSCGDMSRGQSLVVKAIRDGRDTASGIMRYLQKGDTK